MQYAFPILLLLLLQIVFIQGRIALLSTVSFETKVNDDFNKDIGCKFSLNEDLDKNQPLFILPHSETFVTPIANTTDVMFNYGDQVELFCSHGFQISDATSMVVTCDGNDGFLHHGRAYDICKLNCRDSVFHTATRTGKHCSHNATLVKIGFDLGDRFLKLYEACFDEKTLQTYYVKYSLSPWNIQHERAKRDHFLQEPFFPDIELTELYTFENQHNTLGLILGSMDRADSVLNRKRDIFLIRGQLADYGDFVFGAHQATTFRYINVAPQWDKFRSFNWQHIEDGVKMFVTRRNLNLTVYTGTHGVLELPDENGDMQKFYLDFNFHEGSRVPVPRIFYKILHDEQNNAGIALIAVNNPHLTMNEIEDGYIYCEDVSEKIDWLPWIRDYIPGGYSYACDVNEFNDVVQHLALDEIANLLV